MTNEQDDGTGSQWAMPIVYIVVILSVTSCCLAWIFTK